MLPWFERRRRQAAAAQPPVNKARAEKRPGKGNRQDWKHQESSDNRN